MNYKDAFNIVADSNHNRIFTAVINGKKQTMRLFISGDRLCQYKKGSRKWGYLIDLDLLERMTSLKPCDPKTEGVKIFRRNLEKIIKHLSASNLWPQMLMDAKALQKIDDAQIQEWANTDSYELWKQNQNFRENGFLPERTKQTFDYGLVGDIFCHLFKANSIKTINYHPWSKERDIELFANAIANREKYSCRWHKGYDNSIEVEEREGVLKAWYSEEYTGCGNGHYYLALSATHAIFCEND